MVTIFFHIFFSLFLFVALLQTLFLSVILYDDMATLIMEELTTVRLRAPGMQVNTRCISSTKVTYIVFACMPGESYHGWLRSLLSCSCDVFHRHLTPFSVDSTLHLLPYSVWLQHDEDWHCQCMLGYSGVSIIHQTLTWTSGSLTCLCVHSGCKCDAHAYTGDLCLYF